MKCSEPEQLAFTLIYFMTESFENPINLQMCNILFCNSNLIYFSLTETWMQLCNILFQKYDKHKKITYYHM